VVALDGGQAAMRGVQHPEPGLGQRRVFGRPGAEQRAGVGDERRHHLAMAAQDEGNAARDKLRQAVPRRG